VPLCSTGTCTEPAEQLEPEHLCAKCLEKKRREKKEEEADR
jgi:hypothetical protein